MKFTISQKNIPKDWQVKELKEVCNIDFGTRIVKSKVIPGDFYVYGGGDKTFKTNEYNRENCVIISRFAMSPLCVRFVKGKFYLNDSGLSLSILDSRILDQNFIDQLLLTSQNEIYKLGRGVAQKNLNVEDFKKINLILPPLPEQKKIATILTSLDDEIKKVGEMIEKSEDMKKGLIKNFLKNFNKEKMVSLDFVCISITAGGDLPEDYNKNQLIPSEEFKYPIYSNGIDSKSLYGFSKDYKINEDAITISARGTIGYHTIRKANFTPIIRLITLIPNKDIISIYYLNYILDLVKIEHSGGGIPQLTVPNVKKIKIPLVSKDKQKQIAEILGSIDKKIEMYKKLKNKLLELKKGVSGDLLSGKVRVNLK